MKKIIVLVLFLSFAPTSVGRGRLRTLLLLLLICFAPLGVGCAGIDHSFDGLSNRDIGDKIDDLINKGKTKKVEKDRDNDGKPDLIRHYYRGQLVKEKEFPYKIPVKNHPLKIIDLEDITRIEYSNMEFIRFVTRDKKDIARIYRTIIDKSYSIKNEFGGSCDYFWNNKNLRITAKGGGGIAHQCKTAIYIMNKNRVLMKLNGHADSGHHVESDLIKDSESIYIYNHKLGGLFDKITEKYNDNCIENLTDKDYRVRASAASILGKKHSFSKELFKKLFKDEHYFVRFSALRSLIDKSLSNRHELKPIVSDLIYLLHDDNELVRLEAIGLLKTIVGKSFRQPDKWQKWWEENKDK